MSIMKYQRSKEFLFFTYQIKKMPEKISPRPGKQKAKQINFVHSRRFADVRFFWVGQLEGL